MSQFQLLINQIFGELDLFEDETSRLRRNQFASARAKARGGGAFSRAFGTGFGFFKGEGFLRAAAGNPSSFVKLVRGGGTRSKGGMARQMNYLSRDGEVAIFGSDALHDQDILPKASIEQKIQEWTSEWSFAAKTGHSSHIVLSFPRDTNPEIVKYVAKHWGHEFFDSGKYGDQWDYVFAIHNEKDEAGRWHRHAHFVVNRHGEEGQFLRIAHEDGHMSALMLRQGQAYFAQKLGLMLEWAPRLAKGDLTLPPTREEVYQAKRENRLPRPTFRGGLDLQEAQKQMFLFEEGYRKIAFYLKQDEQQYLSDLASQAAGILSQGERMMNEVNQAANRDIAKYGEFQAVLAEQVRQQAALIDEMSPEDAQQSRAELNGFIAEHGQHLPNEVVHELQGTSLNMFRVEGLESDHLDPTNKVIGAQLDEIRSSARELGLNGDAYIQRFVNQQTPHELVETIRSDLVSMLEIDAREAPEFTAEDPQLTEATAKLNALNLQAHIRIQAIGGYLQQKDPSIAFGSAEMAKMVLGENPDHAPDHAVQTDLKLVTYAALASQDEGKSVELEQADRQRLINYIEEKYGSETLHNLKVGMDIGLASAIPDDSLRQSVATQISHSIADAHKSEHEASKPSHSLDDGHEL